MAVIKGSVEILQTKKEETSHVSRFEKLYDLVTSGFSSLFYKNSIGKLIEAIQQGKQDLNIIKSACKDMYKISPQATMTILDIITDQIFYFPVIIKLRNLYKREDPVAPQISQILVYHAKSTLSVHPDASWVQFLQSQIEETHYWNNENPKLFDYERVLLLLLHLWCILQGICILCINND
jgi:hypothetical protein